MFIPRKPNIILLVGCRKYFLKQTFTLYLPQIPSIGHKHPLKFINRLVPLTPRTEARTLTKRTQIIHTHLLIVLTDTIPTVLPQTHILIPYITYYSLPLFV